jgi:hypothetical protein
MHHHSLEFQVTVAVAVGLRESIRVRLGGEQHRDGWVIS